MNKETIKKYNQLLKNINKFEIIKECEINRIKNALSRDYNAMSQLLNNNNFAFHYGIELNQKIKGKEYLIKKHLKSNGMQRITSNIDDEDFIDAIKALQEGYKYNFTFDGFKEITNGFFHYYAPIYTLFVDGYEISYFHYNGCEYLKETNYIIINNYGYQCI